MSEKTSLILLDEGVKWTGDARVVAHWTEVNVPESRESIPQRMEKQSSKIKAEYLAWVHDLSQTFVNGETLVVFLKVLDNLSYWWMTSTAFKSPLESDSLCAIFKLRALEKLYLERGCSGLIYHGNDSTLHRVLQGWCRKMKHPYARFRTNKKMIPRDKGVRKWLRKLPYWIQAIAFLIKNWYLRYRHISSIRSDTVKTLQDEGGVTVVTYFPNIDLEKAKKGEYWSRYWDNVHLVLEQLPFKINWVWLSILGLDSKFNETISLRDICNQTNPKKNHYLLFEEFITWGVFFKALRLYLKIYMKGLCLKEVRKAFSFSGSSINFFPIMKKNWEATFFGNLAVEGAIKIAAFDFMAKTLPTAPWGLFMWEGQSSDIALTSAWRRHRKATRIFAYQHAFSRPFDLRLCSDSRDFKEKGQEAMPWPDKLCINNKEGLSLIRKAGFPEGRIARVEAARYFELKGKFSIYKKPIPPTGRTLLVIMGGVSDGENEFQFRLLREAAEIGGLESYSRILVKPPPDLSSDGLKPVHGSNLQLSITNQPLSDLWPLVDVVYGAHSTGASWEASWYGIPAISVCAMNSLNLNPLAGLTDACFVASGADLSGQLKSPKLAKIPEDYFFLNKDLKLWKDLLQG